MPAGHPTTPLAEALDLKPGMRAFVADMPDHVRADVALDELGLTLLAAPSTGIDAALIFVTTRERLACEVNALRQLMSPGGFVWVSWPKDAAAIPTDLSDRVVRQIAQDAGLGDIKTCAVGEQWSAVKLMMGKELR